MAKGKSGGISQHKRMAMGESVSGMNKGGKVSCMKKGGKVKTSKKSDKC